MNEPPNDSASQPSSGAVDPEPAGAWYRPGNLPLVKLFRLVKRLARNGDLSTAEASAVHAAVRELDSVAAFAHHKVYSREPRTTMDRIYSQYLDFCTSRSWQPHSRSRFERLLRLECKDLKMGSAVSGVTAT